MASVLQRVFPTSDETPLTWEVLTGPDHFAAVGLGDTNYIFDTGPTEDNFGINASAWNALPVRSRITKVEYVFEYDGQGQGANTIDGFIRYNGTQYDGFLSAPIAVGDGINVHRKGFVNPASGGLWTRESLRNIDRIDIELLEPVGGMPGPRVNELSIDVTFDDDPSILEVIGRLLIDRVLSLGEITSSATGFKVKGWQTSKTPASYIAIGSESKGRGPTRSKENQVVFVLPTVVKGADPVVEFMKLYKRIEEVIEADPSLDGLALDAWVSGVSALVTDEEIAKDRHVSDIFVTVDYRHIRGAP
jgi:hypothetical protein